MEKRSILITGAASGIGKAIACDLANKGFNVFAGVRKPTDGETLLQVIGEQGRLTPLIMDVTDDDSIQTAVDQLADSCGNNLYGLINNAGVAFGGPLEIMQMSEIRNLFAVNVTGPLAVTRAAIPLLRQNGRGRIINIGSISGLVALPGLSCYAASKHALEALSDSLRVELAQFGIGLSIIEPGNVETPIWNKALSLSSKMLTKDNADIQKLYARLIGYLEKVSQNPNGIPPQKVADVVFAALTADKPKSRYLVGKDAMVVKIISMLPSKLRDKMLIRTIC